MKKYLPAILILFSLPIYAGDCDNLQERVKQADKYCEAGKKGTNVCGLLALIAAPFTAGLSGTACILPAASTEWVCRQKDWLIKSLNACNSGSKEKYWSQAWNDQKRAERNALTRIKMQEFAAQYNEDIAYSNLRYTTMLDTFEKNCNRNGFNIEADENKEYISHYLNELQIRYDLDIAYYYERYQYKVWQYSSPDGQKEIWERMKFGTMTALRRNEGPKVYEQLYKLDPHCQPKTKEGL